MAFPESPDNNNNNLFLFLYPLKDWDYLLVSNYHRQLNSQPVSGTVDASVSSNTCRTDTGELPTVSNWLFVVLMLQYLISQHFMF